MGQSKQRFYRNGGSSGMNFLSPHAGTSSVPMNARETSLAEGKAKATSWNAGSRNTGALLSALPYTIAVFSAAFLASCITASIATPVQNSDATSAGINADINAVTYYVNIASNNGAGGTISKNIQATYAGTRGIIEDNLIVHSNTPSGYQVYVSMKNDDSKGQNLVNTTDATYKLEPTSGTLSAPTGLTGANTWGVAAPVGSNGIGNAAYGSYTQYTDASVTDATKFGAVPAKNSEGLLFAREGNTVQDGGTTDTIPVYYGYFANSALPSGTYENTVLYTAYAEASADMAGEAQISGNLIYKTGGTARILTSLYTDRDIDASDVEVKINGETCVVTDVKKVDEEAGASGQNDSVVIYCTAPTVKKPGAYPATVKIDRFGLNTVATANYDTDGMTVAGSSTPLKKMQDMTKANCAAWTGDIDTSDIEIWDGTASTPKAFKTGYYTGNYAWDANNAATTVDSKDWDGLKPHYNYGKTSSGANITEADIITDPVGYWSYVGQATIDNINAEVPETYLKDDRDGNWYRVRKLADGNCWMIENLRLVFASDGSVGQVSEDGNTITATSTFINEDNTAVGAAAVGSDPDAVQSEIDNAATIRSQVGAWSTTRWLNGQSETEPSPSGGTFTDNGKVVGTETATNHTTWGSIDGTGTVTNDAEHSRISMRRARSYYNNYTSDQAPYVLDGDEQTVGTYYNWRAATAGTGSAVNNYSTIDSICPKGWQLPVNTGDKSWYNLVIDTYGGGSYNATTNPNGVSTGNYSATKITNGYHTWAMSVNGAMARPISFARSGYNTHLWSSDVVNVGIEADAWGSVSDSSGNAASMIAFFGGNIQVPMPGYFSKGFGIAVRCVAQ